MRRLAVLVSAAVLFALAGAASAATIPQATYVKRADAICLDVARQALALQQEARRRVGSATGDAAALRVFADIYRRQLTLIRSMRRRLVAIGEPRGAATTPRLLIGGIREGRACAPRCDRGRRQRLDRCGRENGDAVSERLAREREGREPLAARLPCLRRRCLTGRCRPAELLVERYELVEPEAAHRGPAVGDDVVGPLQHAELIAGQRRETATARGARRGRGRARTGR